MENTSFYYCDIRPMGNNRYFFEGLGNEKQLMDAGVLTENHTLVILENGIPIIEFNSFEEGQSFIDAINAYYKNISLKIEQYKLSLVKHLGHDIRIMVTGLDANYSVYCDNCNKTIINIDAPDYMSNDEDVAIFEILKAHWGHKIIIEDKGIYCDLCEMHLLEF